MTRRIIGIAGISIWAAVIVFALLTTLQIKADSQKSQNSDSNSSLEVMAKDFVNLLVKRDFAKAVENFDETMKKALPAEKLQETWDSLIAQTGAFKQQTGTRKEKYLQYDIVFVTCKFEKGPLDVKVVYNDKKQVSGLFFVPTKINSRKITEIYEDIANDMPGVQRAA